MPKQGRAAPEGISFWWNTKVDEVSRRCEPLQNLETNQVQSRYSPAGLAWLKASPSSYGCLGVLFVYLSVYLSDRRCCRSPGEVWKKSDACFVDMGTSITNLKDGTHCRKSAVMANYS